MGHREHVRRLEDAVDAAVVALRKKNDLGAYEALRPFCSEEVVATTPPDAEPGDKAGAIPADGTKMPETGATPGTAAAPTPADERTRRRNPGRRRRGLF